MSIAVQNITSQDAWVQGAGGRLFVRLWSPEVDKGLAPIVMLHDSLGSVELWRGFPAALCAATGRSVVAYDRLGFGKSDENPGTLSTEFVAREAETGFAAVKRQLGIGRFVLLGHSVGGGMAVNCAARFPEDCVAVITESAQAFVEDRTVQGIKEARELFSDPEQVDRLKKYHADKAKWVLDAWIESWLHPAFASWSLEPVLPQMTCPALVIHGVEDEYGSTRHPELIGALAGGGAQLEIMADTRHVPHREREDAVVARIVRFLEVLP